MTRYVNIIRLSGRLHACPDLHDTREKAEGALQGVLGNYRTPHLEFVTMPIPIEIPDEKEAN